MVEIVALAILNRREASPFLAESCRLHAGRILHAYKG